MRSTITPVPGEPVALPSPDERLYFTDHIRGLFRAGDREAMRWAFDLWSYQDVADNAPAILQRLRAGSMPCDGAWPEERIELFRGWVDAGSPA